MFSDKLKLNNDMLRKTLAFILCKIIFQNKSQRNFGKKQKRMEINDRYLLFFIDSCVSNYNKIN